MLNVFAEYASIDRGDTYVRNSECTSAMTLPRRPYKILQPASIHQALDNLIQVACSSAQLFNPSKQSSILESCGSCYAAYCVMCVEHVIVLRYK